MPRLNRERLRNWLADEDKSVAWLAEQTGIPKVTLANAIACGDHMRLGRVRAVSRATGIAEADLVAGDDEEGEGTKVEKTHPDKRKNGGGSGPKRPAGAAA